MYTKYVWQMSYQPNNNKIKARSQQMFIIDTFVS